MMRQPIESSNLAAIGHDQATSTLEVEFKPNRHGLAAVWEYAPVSVAIFEAMLDPANSAGGILAGIKRDSCVTARKVEEIQVAA